MKFYSYNYVLGQISQQNWVTIGISGLLILLTGFFAAKAYRNKHDSKFRELSIISILTAGGSGLDQHQQFPNSQSNMTSSNAHSILLRSSQRSWMSKKKMSMSILQQPQMGRS